MRRRLTTPARFATVVAAAAALAVSGCSSSGSKTTSAGGSIKGQTITYWASNQAPTVQDDVKDLTPQLQKFTSQTGVKVNLQVIDWAHLQTKILAAVSSGEGPDVLNIGNTWAASLQSTGAFLPFTTSAFNAVGGKSKFVAGALATDGAPNQTPTSVPLYSLAYGLYYNKAMFAAKNLPPPTTWQQLVSDAKALTGHGVYGITLEAGSYTENVHFAFIFGQQHGGNLFNGDTATFTNPGVIAGVKQYIDLMDVDHVVNPSDAQYTEGTSTLGDFAKGKVAMVMNQNNANATLSADGMKPSQYGVVPIPAPSPLPSAGKDIATFPAGINISIFKNSQHIAADEAFVKFMTSVPEQEVLGQELTTLPVNTAAKATWTTDTALAGTFKNILANQAAPLPLTKNEADMETAVGNAITPLFAQAATGHVVTASDIKAAMEQAQAKMPAS